MIEKFRKIIKEAFGVVFEIDRLADAAAKETVGTLRIEKRNKKITLLTKNFEFIYYVKEPIINKILINKIKIKIEFINNVDINKVSNGKILLDKTIKYTDKGIYNYDIIIELKLNRNFTDEILKPLSEVFAHELHHAYDYIKRDGKESKTNSFNGTRNLNKFSNLLSGIKNPEIIDFMNHFYLIIPQEINARVQEAHNIIKHHKDKNNEEFTEKLLHIKPVQDAKRMMGYRTDDVMMLPENILKQFISNFNKDMKSSLFGLNGIKYPQTDIKAFFDFWRKRINKEGYNLFIKITKMAGATKNLDEMGIIRIAYMNNSLVLENIFGHDMFHHNCHGPNIYPDYLENDCDFKSSIIE